VIRIHNEKLDNPSAMVWLITAILQQWRKKTHPTPLSMRGAFFFDTALIEILVGPRAGSVTVAGDQLSVFCDKVIRRKRIAGD
jgi:hypothetical protein